MRPPIERVLARIEIDEFGCWLWMGALDGKGYGQIKVAGSTKRTHRVVFEHYSASPTPPVEVDHLCRNIRCCNPDHLEAVSKRENVLRGDSGAQSLVCGRGHWVLGENMVWHQRGNGTRQRKCRACLRLAYRAKNERRRAARRRADR